MRKVTSWNTPFGKVKFLEKEFDFQISPQHFIKWLKMEEEYIDFSQPYNEIVGGMCEYSCLYVAMLLHNSPLKGNLKIVYGNFGFWEHFWLEYTIKKQTYIIDLTLQQFLPNAPKLAISLKEYKDNIYNAENSTPIEIKEYLESVKAFEFYQDPKNLKIKPPKSINNFSQLMNGKVNKLMSNFDEFTF